MSRKGLKQGVYTIQQSIPLCGHFRTHAQNQITQGGDRQPWTAVLALSDLIGMAWPIIAERRFFFFPTPALSRSSCTKIWSIKRDDEGKITTANYYQSWPFPCSPPDQITKMTFRASPLRQTDRFCVFSPLGQHHSFFRYSWTSIIRTRRDLSKKSG